MAKKKRQTPPPPRRPVPSPKVRTDPRRPRDPRRTRMLLAAVAGVLIVAAAIVGVALVAAGGDDEANAALTAAGCDFRTVPSQVPYEAGGGTGGGRAHFLQKPEEFRYNSFPPSQGPHHPNPLLFNFYDRPVPQFNLVHNLEHGGIAVQYGSEVSEQTVQQIAAWYQEDPNGIIVAPLPGLAGEIALTAWNEQGGTATEEIYRQSVGRIAKCPRFDEAAFSEFRDAYRAEAVEPFPLEALTPGS